MSFEDMKLTGLIVDIGNGDTVEEYVLQPNDLKSENKQPAPNNPINSSSL